ncbi:hypothetical protein CONCODRAFT_78377, partial [Conidiobolus coronatus NRRL 28638]
MPELCKKYKFLKILKLDQVDVLLIGFLSCFVLGNGFLFSVINFGLLLFYSTILYELFSIKFYI